MDFTNRDAQSHQAPAAPSRATAGVDSVSSGRTKRGRLNGQGGERWIRVTTTILLFAIAILLIAIALSIYFGGNDESRYLNTSDLQAVDISVGGSSGGDQIYFGNIKNLNSQYFVIDNVYYIPSTTSQTSNITLQPLICQIDSPFDQMIVNRSSINWWENLQPSSKVVKTITNYEKSNAGKPSCPTSSTGSSSSSTTGSSTPTSTNTTEQPATSSKSPTTTP